MNGTQKALIGIVVAFCLVLAVVAGWALGTLRATLSATALEADLRPGRYGQEGLRVSGTAVVRAAPDIAAFRIGYESRSLRARQAKLANDRVMRKAIAAMERVGVGRKDIQTVEYQVFPVWENWPRPTTRTLFWHVLHMVEVRVRKVEKVADVIDAASAAGADKVDNVHFSVDSLHKLRTQARRMAARVAREKGEQLARLMGRRLGKAMAIVDSSSSWPWWGGAGANVAAQMTAQVPSTSAIPESVVSAGQVVVEAREEVVFAME